MAPAPGAALACLVSGAGLQAKLEPAAMSIIGEVLPPRGKPLRVGEDVAGGIALGTLDGDGKFVVPAGLDMEAYPLVDVSIEPLDGNPAHSTKSVLRGRLEQT